jgi:hypothetical protein
MIADGDKQHEAFEYKVEKIANSLGWGLSPVVELLPKHQKTILMKALSLLVL